MRLLLDTHLLLWAAATPDRLPEAAATLMADPDNDLLFSVASIWECSIKRALNRADFTLNPALLRQGLLSAGYAELPVTGTHALATAILPPVHRDPFDRMLVAQATVEAVTLLTSDAKLAHYPGPVRFV